MFTHAEGGSVQTHTPPLLRIMIRRDVCQSVATLTATRFYIIVARLTFSGIIVDAFIHAPCKLQEE